MVLVLALAMFPDKLLDTLSQHVFEADPLLRLGFLAELGSRMHASAARVLIGHGNLVIEDDMRAYSSLDAAALGPVAAVMHNPARYGPLVRRLTVCDPRRFDNFEPRRARDSSPLLQFSSSDDTEEDNDDATLGLVEPLTGAKLDELLGACCNLIELIWLSATPPPDGLCEAIASRNSKLTTLGFVPEPSMVPLPPQIPAHARFIPPRWDALSLPLLASLPISTLHLSRLSQTGARSLGALFSKLRDDSILETLTLDFLWLDDPLCERLVEASKKLRRLRLSTNGTKLTDRGIRAVLENVDTLEALDLVEVEGRLSRSLWEKVELPPSLTHFSVRISEAGPHHSWVADHLHSLSSLSFAHLTTIHVVRTLHPFDRRLDAVAVLQPLPSELARSLRAARSLQVLECDWWAWSAENLKAVLESCQKLQIMRVAFDGPFIKLLTLTSVFAPAPLLRALHIYISTTNAPLTPVSTYSHPLTPSASPVVSSSTTLPSASVSDSPPLYSSSSFDEGKAGASGAEPDPHLPPVRDVKKFVRRCQALTLLEWYGWNGRGSWIVTRPPGTTKSTLNVAVEHILPTPPEPMQVQQYALEEQAARVGWFPGSCERAGQTWTGAWAEKCVSELRAEKDKEEFTTPAKTKARKTSSSSSARFDSSFDTLGLPLTPSTTKTFSPPPLTPLKIGRDSLPTNSEPLSPKSPPAHGRHRRSTTESSVHADSSRSSVEHGASGRRKSVGGAGAKSAGRSTSNSFLNTASRPVAGSRQNRSEATKGRAGKVVDLKSTTG